MLYLLRSNMRLVRRTVILKRSTVHSSGLSCRAKEFIGLTFQSSAYRERSNFPWLAGSLSARDAIVITTGYYSSESPCARTIRGYQGLKKRGLTCRNKVQSIIEKPPSIMTTLQNIIAPLPNTMKHGTMRKPVIKRM